MCIRDRTNDESHAGLSGISVAILDPAGTTPFAPYFAFSAAQVGRPERQELADMLLDMAARLGGTPKPALDLLERAHD